MTELFTCCRDTASCPSIKQSHLGKCSNWRLRVSTLVNDGNVKFIADIADFASEFSSVKMLIMLNIWPASVFCNIVVFLSLLSPENYLRWRCTLPWIAKLWKHPWGRFFFDNLKKFLAEVSFHHHLQLCKNIFEWLVSYEVTSCKKE